MNCTSRCLRSAGGGISAVDVTAAQAGRRARTLRWVLSGAGLFILVLFISHTDFGTLASAAAGLRWPYVLQAVAFLLLNLALKAFRWQYMVLRATGARVGWTNASTAVLAGVAGASLLPGRAFDAAKPLLLHVSHGVPVSQGLALALVERVLDVAALFVVFFATVNVAPRVFTGPAQATVLLVSLPLAFGMVAALLFADAWLKPLQRWAARRFKSAPSSPAIDAIAAAADTAWRSTRDWVPPVVSLLAIFAEVGRAHAVFHAFGLDLPVAWVAFTFAASVVAGLIALIPGGVGITEMSQASLVALLASDALTGPVRGAVLFDRFLSYYLLVVLGGAVLLAALPTRPVRPPRQS